jgi:hypothetical protein
MKLRILVADGNTAFLPTLTSALGLSSTSWHRSNSLLNNSNSIISEGHGRPRISLFVGFLLKRDSSFCSEWQTKAVFQQAAKMESYGYSSERTEALAPWQAVGENGSRGSGDL